VRIITVGPSLRHALFGDEIFVVDNDDRVGDHRNAEAVSVNHSRIDAEDPAPIDSLEKVTELFVLGDQVGSHHHGIIGEIPRLHLQHQALVRWPETGIFDLDKWEFFLKGLVDLANLFFIQISAPGNFPFFFGAGDDRAYGDLFTRLGSRREGAHEARSNEQPSQSNDDYEPV